VQVAAVCRVHSPELLQAVVVVPAPPAARSPLRMAMIGFNAAVARTTGPLTAARFNRTGRTKSSQSIISDTSRPARSAAPEKAAHPNSVIATGLPCALPCATKCADVLAEARGHLGRPIVGIGRNDIERLPVNAIERNRGGEDKEKLLFEAGIFPDESG
jgi:hypothetical protein